MEFLANQKNVSQNTVKSYRDTFKILLNFWNNQQKIKISNITFKNFTKENIIEFLNYLEKERKNSPEKVFAILLINILPNLKSFLTQFQVNYTRICLDIQKPCIYFKVV